MTQESVISQQMRDAIGVESEAITHEVEKGAIIKFAQAIGDTNPLFNDEGVARQTRYGGIIAPPTFMRSLISNARPLTRVHTPPISMVAVSGSTSIPCAPATALQSRLCSQTCSSVRADWAICCSACEKLSM